MQYTVIWKVEGLTVTPTTFIYKGGREIGAIVGIINYPRFPLKVKDLKLRIMVLARLLLIKLKQQRLSVVFPDQTILVER